MEGNFHHFQDLPSAKSCWHMTILRLLVGLARHTKSSSRFPGTGQTPHVAGRAHRDFVFHVAGRIIQLNEQFCHIFLRQKVCFDL